MLCEIMSEEFIAHGAQRGKIRFHPGLNVVIGGEQSDNSIGKSTFLLAIDFCFGGNSYYTKTDLKTRFLDKKHTVYFAFQFGEITSYFSRSIVTPETVNVCDENYFTQKSITLDEFKNYLWNGYKLTLVEMSFRDVVSRFMRIYGKDNYNERRPLEAHAKDSMRNGIVGMEKLFGYYEQLKPYIQRQDLTNKRKKTANDAIRGEVYTITVPNKKQFKKNQQEIEQLNLELEELVISADKNMTESDLTNADELLIKRDFISSLKRKRSSLISRKNAIERNIGNMAITSQDYEELKHFFPDVNIAKIDAVQSFHRKIQLVMAEETKEELQEIETMTVIVNRQIEEKENEIRKMGIGVTLPRSFLKKYAELTKRVELLKAENAAKDQLDQIKKDAISAKESAQQVEQELLKLIADKINEQMVRYNDFIYEGTQNAPVLSFESQKQYTFITPDDDGMGTGYKSMIIYDLSVLKLTQLPVIIHDSLMFNHIGYQPLEKIMELYLDSGKQIFIAYDKKKAPTSRIQEILDNSAVLNLSQGGNELFGYSWAKKDL